MKKQILTFILCTFFILSIKSQNYCDTYFSAYSIKVGVKCRYCDEVKSVIIPQKIKFNSSLVCESFKNLKSASAEGKCKLSTILHYITSLFWDTWVQSNAFASQQCFGDENPNFAHKAYEYDYEVGLKEYGIDKKELESIMEEINYSKNFMDYPSYQAGRKVSAQYSLKVITNSCD